MTIHSIPKFVSTYPLIRLFLKNYGQIIKMCGTPYFTTINFFISSFSNQFLLFFQIQNIHHDYSIYWKKCYTTTTHYWPVILVGLILILLIKRVLNIYRRYLILLHLWTLFLGLVGQIQTLWNIELIILIKYYVHNNTY